MESHIQIGAVAPRIQYTGDGVQAAFTYPFPVFAAGDVEVYVDTARLTPEADYAVTGVGDSAGGAVTLTVPPGPGAVVTVRRHMAVQRTTDFQEGGELRAKTLNDNLDYLTAAIQQVESAVGRSLRLNEVDASPDAVLPLVAQRAGKYLAFDGNGAPVAAIEPGAYPATAFAATLLDDVDATAARTTLGLGALAGRDAVAVADLAADVQGLLGAAGGNRIINGNFTTNQRGVTGTVVLTAGQYGHDRWKAGAGGCTYTFATLDNVTTLTITAGTLVQVVEGAVLSSGMHTLSWAGTAQGRIDGGGYGTTGITGPATGGTDMVVEFATGTVSKVQLKAGGTATEYAFFGGNAIADARACLRYYWKMSGTAVPSYDNHNQANATCTMNVTFPVPMRVAPTGAWGHYTFVNCTAALSFNTMTTFGRIMSNCTATGRVTIVPTGGTAYIVFDAEI